MTAEEKIMTACVTGGTGYIAAALVKLLLEDGYRVHATTRNPDDNAKNAHLLALRGIGEVKLFRADLKEEGSFDEAINGCDYVFHLALPDGGLESDDVEEMIKYTKKGTIDVLRACVKARTVKRVIYASSVAAISAKRHEETGLVVDEEWWSDVEYLASVKPPSWVYHVAKTLAEKEASEFAKENNLDLVSVNPVFVVGPGLTPEPPICIRLALSMLTGEEWLVATLKAMQQLSGSISIVHLDDVCRAFVFLAETESASGRYIVARVNSDEGELARFLFGRYPHLKCSNLHLDDFAEKAKLCFSSEKLVQAGFQFKHENLEEIYDDAVAYAVKVGMFPTTTGS